MNEYHIVTTWKDDHDIIMPRHPDKDTKSRLSYFLDWLAYSGRNWLTPDLAVYRDFLLNERVRINLLTGSEVEARLSPSTVQAHLATIRGRYQEILRDNYVRQKLYNFAPPHLGIADKKAFVDEILVRLQNATHPSTATVEVAVVQDVADSNYLRLKPDEVRALLRAPGINTLHGLRDTTMMALMVCTGIREAELVALDVPDIKQKLNGELSIHIREGKGNKERLVPYGALDWCVIYLEEWLSSAQIYRGAVFRGFFKGNKRVRPTRISTRAVNHIMNRYPIVIDGELREVKPHDLRRTYARNAYENGMDLERIRQNLGHTSLQTTQTYIGELDVQQRRPPRMFTAPHRLTQLSGASNGD